MYQPGYGPLPLAEALDASRGVIDENAIRLMYDTTLTPFGDFPDFEDAVHAPFKPATHGQFRFTRLNIVDMFGQAVSAIYPARGVEPNLHPYISEFYECTPDPTSDPPVTRSVLTDDGQSAQLGPYMNQDSRLNVYYVKRDDGHKTWAPVSEYDNPIWGWLVVNCVDSGLQLLLPGGTFYREVRLGGPDGTSTTGTRDSLPFGAPTDESGIPPQLSTLLKMFHEKAGCLKEFFEVTTGALDHTMYTPTQYAGYFTAITGKPFALVSAGVSLELPQPPHVAAAEPGLAPYGFPPIKIDDKNRAFDGLLGCFKELAPTQFDLDNFYTYFPSRNGGNSLTVIIEPNNYPTLTLCYNAPGSGDANYIVKTPTQIITEANNQLTVLGMVVDPFTVTQIYTSFQRLPQWVLEQSFNEEHHGILPPGPDHCALRRPRLRSVTQASIRLEAGQYPRCPKALLSLRSRQ